MAKILDQSLQNNILKGEREFFPRSTAFYYNDSLAIKISKVVFPIFILCYLVLSIKDIIDIVLSKKHFKRITSTEPAKNKSDQFISKYGTTIMAAGALVALGYAAYKFLPTQTNSSITTPSISQKLLKVKNSIEDHDITWLKNVDRKIYLSLAATTATLASIIIGLSNSSRKKPSFQPSNPAVNLPSSPPAREIERPNTAASDIRRNSFSILQSVKQGAIPRSLSLTDLSGYTPKSLPSQLLREKEIINPQIEMGPTYAPDGPLVAATVASSNQISLSFDDDTELVPMHYNFNDKHRIVMEGLKNRAYELGLFVWLERTDIKNATASYWPFSNSFSYDLKLCLENLKNSGKQEYAKHKAFIKSLRALLKHPKETLKNYEVRIIKDLETLASYRFSNQTLSSYLEGLLNNSIPFEETKVANLNELTTKLKEFNKKIHAAAGINIYVAFQKFLGAIGWFFDPQAEHNIPYPRSAFSIESINGDKIVIHLRHSTPTNGFSVNDEFKGFLTNADTKNRKMGYYSLQDPHGQADGQRVKAISGLQDEFENFFVWSLPFDGKIFALVEKVKTDGSREKLTEFATMPDNIYKKILINEFFRKPKNSNAASAATPVNVKFKSLKNGLVDVIREASPNQDDEALPEDLQKLIDLEPIRFAIPKNIEDEKELKAFLTKLLDDIHRLYFPRDLNLSSNVSKRRTMTLLFYAHLVDAMAARYGLDYIVTSCKDNKDRGGAMNAICEIVRMIKTGKLNNQEMLEKLLIHVLGAGIHTKDEHILENRLVFLIDAINHIASLSNEEIEAIRKHFNNPEDLGTITSFEYMEDNLIPANPFEVSSKEDFLNILNIHVNRKGSDKIIHKGNLSIDEFNNIFQTYGNKETGLLNPKEIYRVFNKDLTRAFAPGHGAILLKTTSEPNVKYKSYEKNNGEELLKAIGLPTNWKDVDLKIHDKALRFLILLCQSSGASGLEIFYKNQKLQDTFESLNINIRPGEDLSLEAEFIPDEDTLKVKFRNSSYFFYTDKNENLAKIFFETQFDLVNKKISYNWRVDRLDAELELPESQPVSGPDLVALPAVPMQQNISIVGKTPPSLNHPKRRSKPTSRIVPPAFSSNSPIAALLDISRPTEPLIKEAPPAQRIKKVFNVINESEARQFHKIAKAHFLMLRNASNFLRPLTLDEQSDNKEALRILFQTQFEFLANQLGLTSEIPDSKQEKGVYMNKLESILDIQIKSFAPLLKVNMNANEYIRTFNVGKNNKSITILGDLFIKSFNSFFKIGSKNDAEYSALVDFLFNDPDDLIDPSKEQENQDRAQEKSIVKEDNPIKNLMKWDASRTNIENTSRDVARFGVYRLIQSTNAMHKIEALPTEIDMRIVGAHARHLLIPAEIANYQIRLKESS